MCHGTGEDFNVECTLRKEINGFMLFSVEGQLEEYTRAHANEEKKEVD